MQVNRREYLAAAIALLGGCAGRDYDEDESMSEATARENFSDIKHFDNPVTDRDTDGKVVRFVDEEAGVVLWAADQSSRYDDGIALTALPAKQTDLLE